MFFSMFCLSILCLFYIFAFLCFVVLCFVIDSAGRRDKKGFYICSEVIDIITDANSGC